MAAVTDQRRGPPRSRSYQSHLPADLVQRYLDTQQLVREGDPMGTPRWKGEVESTPDGHHRNIKIPSALLQDPRWYSPPMQELGHFGWGNTDFLYGREEPRPLRDHPPTVHKAVVLAEPLLHPWPRPMAPLVLVRILNDKSIDVPGGFPSTADREIATEAGAPRDYVLTSMYRLVAEKTNIHPTDLAPMLDVAGLPITTQGGFTRSGEQRFRVQYWFFRYLGRVPHPWVMEPIYDTQHSSQSVPDPRPLYDDTPLQSVARAWIPLGTLLDPEARSHTYQGLRPLSKGPANSLAEAVQKVVYSAALPFGALLHGNPNVCPHRQFLRQHPGCLDWTTAWPTSVGDPRWAPAQLVERRWAFFLFRDHPIKYEYIDLPRELSEELYVYQAPDDPDQTRDQLATWSRAAAERSRPHTEQDHDPQHMRLAVPAEVPAPFYHGGSGPRHRPTNMESLDETEQIRRIQHASGLVDSWPAQNQTFHFTLAGPREHPPAEAQDDEPPADAPAEDDPGEPPESDSDGDDRSVFSAALAHNRLLGLAPPSEPASVASTTRSTLSAHQEAEARRLRAAEIPAPHNPINSTAVPITPEEEHLEARQFWFGQRVWTLQAPRNEAYQIPTREIGSHDLAYMSTFIDYAGHATQIGYKEVTIGSLRPFQARAPIFDLPFGDLNPLQASALSQLLQFHLSDHMLESGCPWCPHTKEDLPKGIPDHQRLAAIWHLVATHPKEYFETLQHLYQAGPMPVRAPERTNWRSVPRAFYNYLEGLPTRASSSRPAGHPRPREDRPPDARSDSGRPSRLPTLVEQGPAEVPEVDV